MIVVAIVALSAVVLTAVFAVFKGLPSLPDGVMELIDRFIGYIGDGASLLFTFVYADIVKGLLAALLALVVVFEGYKFVMWIVKKIPMFGVSD